MDLGLEEAAASGHEAAEESVKVSAAVAKVSTSAVNEATLFGVVDGGDGLLLPTTTGAAAPGAAATDSFCEFVPDILQQALQEVSVSGGEALVTATPVAGTSKIATSNTTSMSGFADADLSFLLETSSNDTTSLVPSSLSDAVAALPLVPSSVEGLLADTPTSR